MKAKRLLALTLLIALVLASLTPPVHGEMLSGPATVQGSQPPKNPTQTTIPTPWAGPGLSHHERNSQSSLQVLVSTASGASEITVDATVNWVNTGIQVNVGDALTITATGAWTPGPPEYGMVGPDGSLIEWPDNFLNLADIGTCAYCATTPTPHWAALIGYIGENPPGPGSYTSYDVIPEAMRIFVVGSNFITNSVLGGTLWLNFNDAAYSSVTSDNSGEVIAQIGGLTYSISGRVVDGSGNPIPGVTISDNVGHTTTTGSDGRYTLSGLAAGAYTITPSKSGYTFSPAARTVTLPPDATRVDFTGTSGGPRIRVEPTSGLPGTRFYIYGSGFIPGESVQQWVIMPSGNRFDDPSPETVDGQGNYTSWIEDVVGLIGTYTLYARGNQSQQTVSAQFQITLNPAPTNDDFDYAHALVEPPPRGGVNQVLDPDTNRATVAPDDPDMGCGVEQNSHTLWFKLTTSYHGRMRLRTYSELSPAGNSTYDTVVAVFTGQRGSLHLIACNDDAPGHEPLSDLTFEVEPGRTYYIEVASYKDSPGGTLSLFYNYEYIYYSISGRVVDGSGNPIAGVTISNGAGHTAITDSSGNYTLRGLMAGTYTITPGKSGYTFVPTSRTVTVPPDVTGKNFTGTLVPTTGKTPVVFVHGWRGFPPQIFGCTNQKYQPISLQEAKDYFQGLGDRLKADGGYSDSEIFYARLVSNPCYTPSLRDNIPRLIAAIDEAKAATGKRKVILIAHSMGGLVARAYIEGPNYRNDVESLFTFGSPHHGVPADVIPFLLNGLTLGSTCADYQPAVCDFTVLGMWLFNNNHRKNNNVIYHLISGSAPFFSRNPLGMAMDALIRGSDDGIVPTGSGILLPGVNDSLETDEVHSHIFGQNTYFTRNSGSSKSYTECIKRVLVDGLPNCRTVSAAATLQQDISAILTQHTPLEYGRLLSGQTAIRNLSLEGGPTLFAAQWQDGKLAFMLIDPNGQTIDPAFANANPDVVTYTEDDDAATYLFHDATAGAWQMVLQAVNVPDSAAFTTFASFDSNVTLAGSTDQQWYAPGAGAILMATLSGSPINAAVTATILRADGFIDTLPLSSVGDGQYQAVYSVPDAPGYAEVRLVATGTTADGLAFERGTSLAFQISPNTFTLADGYSDFRTDSGLNVTVDINATVNGAVGLSADLVDASGNFVAHALAIEDVNAGAATLTLQFDGATIFASQRNGPYILTNVLLTDERGASLVTQEAQEVYMTAPYQYVDFASSQLYLPMVTRNP
jgi:hypothetical protein